MDETTLALLKQLLGVTGDAQDALLAFVYDDARQAVLNYCNIEAVPPELDSTLLRIAADIWRAEGFGLTEEQCKVVHSVSDGSQSVTYEAAKDRTAGIADIVRKYAPALNAFRRLRGWG